MKVLIAAEYDANYLTIAGVPVHIVPEAVAAAKAEADTLVRAIAYEEARRAFNDQGPAGPGEPAPVALMVDEEDRAVGAPPDDSASVAEPPRGTSNPIFAGGPTWAMDPFAGEVGIIRPDPLPEGEMEDGTVPGYRCAPDGPLPEPAA